MVIVGIRFEILFEILLDLMNNDDSWVWVFEDGLSSVFQVYR